MNGDETMTQPAALKIAPWLYVADAAKAIDYYTAAFDAVELERLEDEAGSVVVAQLTVREATFWVQQAGKTDQQALGDASPVRMILMVEVPDSVFSRAIAAGATELAPTAEGHGWRSGHIIDPSGHQWEVAKRLAL